MWLLNRLIALFGLLWSWAGATISLAQAPAISFDRGAIFDEVWAHVKEEFYDSAAVGPSWSQARDQFRPLAMQAQSHAEFAEVMSDLLVILNASHTSYFAATNAKRAQMFGVFERLVPDGKEQLFHYDSIGIEVEQFDNKIFVRSVYDGFPASAAGVLYGDEIVSVDGVPFQAIESFRGKRAVKLQLRRTENGEPRSLTVPVETLDGRTMFLKSMKASARVIEYQQKSIAYVHVWSYAGSKYQEYLTELLLFDKLKDADALVLDLRDGLGGASLEYLNLFRNPIASVTTRSRTGQTANFHGVWGKPVVLLINGRSTSGKELFAFGFKKLALGEAIGDRTAGAVLAGKGIMLSNGDFLYLAVTDIEVDGVRLEGRGVEPTISVKRPLPYAAGTDPQLEQALKILTQESSDR